jgi:hypothetical protein
VASQEGLNSIGVNSFQRCCTCIIFCLGSAIGNTLKNLGGRVWCSTHGEKGVGDITVGILSK